MARDMGEAAAVRNWLRRIRGALGLGLTWAAGWSLVGAFLAVLPVAAPVGGPGVLALVVGFVVQFAAMGFVGGAAFSAVLGLIEGRRRFDQMSLPRFAAWGALGGLFLSVFKNTIGLFSLGLLGTLGVPAYTVTHAISVGVITLLGAGSAAGSLAVARAVDDRELLEAAAEVADIGLTEDESRDLLGRTGLH